MQRTVIMQLNFGRSLVAAAMNAEQVISEMKKIFAYSDPAFDMVDLVSDEDTMRISRAEFPTLTPQSLRQDIGHRSFRRKTEAIQRSLSRGRNARRLRSGQ